MACLVTAEAIELPSLVSCTLGGSYYPRNGIVIFAGTEIENENAECGMTLQPERNEVEIGEKGEYINKSSYEACTFQKCNDAILYRVIQQVGVILISQRLIYGVISYSSARAQCRPHSWFSIVYINSIQPLSRQ